NGWTRRIVMMLFGAGVGLGALWLDGKIGLPSSTEVVADQGRFTELANYLPNNESLPQTLGSLTYFALAFFALRWWKMTDRRRSQRFSFGPILAAAIWSFILFAFSPNYWRGPVVLMVAAAIVQLVSPWEAPPPPASRKMRLRAV